VRRRLRDWSKARGRIPKNGEEMTDRASHHAEMPQRVAKAHLRVGDVEAHAATVAQPASEQPSKSGRRNGGHHRLNGDDAHPSHAHIEADREARGDRIGSNAIRRLKKGPEKAAGRARRGQKCASLGGLNKRSGRLEARAGEFAFECSRRRTAQVQSRDCCGAGRPQSWMTAVCLKPSLARLRSNDYFF
jgi:hypothetical protein